MVDAIASVAGSVIGASGAKKAAKTQAAAADRATQAQEGMYNTTRGDLLPYNTQGQNALTKAYDIAGNAPTFNFHPSQADIESTPGYQFNLAQGERAAQNSAAARGLGISGASEKGAMNYASGLADNTYQNLFNDAYNTYGAKLSGYKTNYDTYSGLSSLGENAAAHTGTAATSLGSSIGNNIVGAANAQGAATIAGANMLVNGANNFAKYNLAQQQLGNAGTVYANSGPYDTTAAQGGLPWSDIRLKEHIEPIGEQDGIPLYRFSYIGSSARYEGVMAQDILEIKPEAVAKIGDFYAVDYRQLGVEFKKVS